MVTNRRRRSQRRRADLERINLDRFRHLTLGNHWFGGCRTKEELVSTWHRHRDLILPAFVETFPGYRPFGEWLAVLIPKYGERQLVDVDQERAQACRETWHFGALHTHFLPALQEREETYLRHHGLLTAEEKKALAAGEGHELFDPDCSNGDLYRSLYGEAPD
jgi:hypothetical protein